MSRPLGLVVVAVCAMAVPTFATTVFDVDRTDDSAIATSCTAAPNDCSLRGAIIAANATVGSDTINLPAGTYTLAIAGAGEDMAASGDLDIRDDVTIAGAGAATTVIDGAMLDRVIHSDPAGTGISVAIHDVTIQHGKTVAISFVLADGGAVRNGTPSTLGGNVGGTLTLTNVVVKDSTSERAGAGIGNSGTLMLFHTTVSGNVSDTNGGGIFQDDGGSLSIVDSTISGNTASQGGGIFIGAFSITADPMVTITRSTISGNMSPSTGGIFYNRGSLTLLDSTVSGNQNIGVGAFSAACTVRGSTIAGNAANGFTANVGATVANTILAGNSGGTGSDCGGTFTSGGHNLIQNATGCTIDGDTTGNVLGQDPMLGPLADNGGSTQTHALLAGSPAIDAGNPATPGSGGFACETTDQREIARPQPVGGTCDIGAFELVPVATTTTTSTTTTSTTSTSTSTITTTSSAPPSTAIASTTSSSSTAVTPTTTPTATTAPPTTTTTLPTGPCDGVPLTPPTFTSIDCRLAALLARVNGEPGLGAFQAKLAQSVGKARMKAGEAASLCADNVKKTKKRLQQAATAMKQYVHRLNGLAARKKLDATLRQSFAADGAAIAADLKALRADLRC